MKNLQARDTLLAITLFCLGILTRLPFRSQILYHWDSVNFALGMERFDVSLHQPHPPGYFLYIALARLVNLLVGDANASLVWISTVSTGLATVAMFLLGWSLWNRRSGIIAALLLLSSPLFWFHGEVALSYMVEAVFVILVALLCYRHLAQEDSRLWLSAIVLGVAGGFRQNTMVFLLPLWALAAWRFRWRKMVLGLIALAITCATWLLPMVLLSGGATRYWEAVGASGQEVAEGSSFFDAGQIIVNGARLAVFTGYALCFGLACLAWGIWYLVKHHRQYWRSWMREPRVRALVWWVGPSLCFYLFIHIRQPGHSFTFMPAVLLILSFILVEVIPKATSRWKHSGWLDSIAVLLVVLSNTAFFLSGPPLLFGQERHIFNTPSWSSIRSRDSIVGEKLRYIRDRFSPENTAVLAARLDFRLPDYYLRDYQFPSLSHRIAGEPEGIALADDVWILVLFNEEIDVIGGSNCVLQSVRLPCGETLRWLERSENQEFVVLASAVGVRDRDGQ